MTAPQPIPQVVQADLARLCARHGVAILRVFGSALRDDFGPASDIDVVVRFLPGIDPDLFELGGLQQDLSDLLGRVVDLKTEDMFTPPNLQRVITSSITAYAA